MSDLVRYYPFDEMRRRIDSLFEGNASPLPGVAAIDVKEESDKVIVAVDLPGVKKEDVKINLEGRRLMVSAKRSEERSSENAGYQRFERVVGSIQRAVDLPSEVVADEAIAELEDGVLRIELPRSNKGHGKIEIK